MLKSESKIVVCDEIRAGLLLEHRRTMVLTRRKDPFNWIAMNAKHPTFMDRAINPSCTPEMVAVMSKLCDFKSKDSVSPQDVVKYIISKQD
jgi:hypothetical protein